MANGGMFEGIGLTPLSEEEILAQRSQEMQARQAEFLKQQLQGVDPTTAAGMRTGNLFGQLLARKFGGGPKLTAKEQAQIDVKEAARQRVDALRTKPEWAKATPDEQSAMMLEAHAQAAADAGMIDVATQAAQQAATIRRAARQARVNIESMEANTERTKQATEIAGEKRLRDKAGEFGSFIVTGPKGTYDWNPARAQRVQGRVTPEGMLIDNQGNVHDSFLAEDEYMEVAETIADQTDGDPSAWAGLNDNQRLTQFRQMAGGTSGMKEKKEKLRAVRTQMAITERVGQLLDAMEAKGENPNVILDGSGRIVSFTSNLKNTVQSLGDAFYVPIRNAEGKLMHSGKGTADSLMEAVGFDEEGIRIPEGLTANAASEYRSAVVQLAYAVARANEPGARQLSDTDFRNALQEIGAESADAEKFQSVIRSNLYRKLALIKNDRQHVLAIARSLDVPEQDARNFVYGGELSDFDKQAQAILDDLATGIGEDFVPHGPEDKAPAQQGRAAPADAQWNEAGDGYSWTIIE